MLDCMRKSGHSQVVSPHSGLNFPMGKLAGLRIGRAVLQHFAAALIETEPKVELIGRRRLRRILPRREPLLHQVAFLQTHRIQADSASSDRFASNAVVGILVLRLWECAQQAPTPAGRR